MLNAFFKPRSIPFYSALFCIVFFLDRMSKWFALHSLALHDVPVFKGFTLTFSINHGVSWNLFATSTPHGQYLLISFVSFVFILFLYYANIQYKQNIGLIPEVFIIGGAVGNLFDRFLYGGVIDFLLLHISDWHWPTFNIADCFIFMGVVLIFIRNYYEYDGNI